jgi:Zn-dependent peptidase ImmA (M78 family)/transcriptional regulator with XRE-family HTH domain
MTEKTVLERIRSLMTERKVKQSDLAATLGVSEAVVSRLMAGERKLSAAELGTIADLLGASTGFLLGRTTTDVRPFAVAARLGQTEHAPELNSVFARAQSLLELRGVLSRLVDSPRREAPVEVERPSTTVYLDAGEEMGNRVREALGLGDEPIENLVELVEVGFGVDVSIEPLPGDLHGVFVTDGSPSDDGVARVSVMLVNSSDNYGRQRFTLAHELGHLLFGDAELYWADYRRRDEGSGGQGAHKERRANRFAGSLLMPAVGVRALVAERRALPEDARERRFALAELVVGTSLHFGASVDAARVRLSSLGLLTGRDQDFVMAESTYTLIDLAGKIRERGRLLEHQHVVKPPPRLRDQALFAYAEGMVGIEPLAQLWRSDDVEGLRRELAAQGWAPAYS